LGWGGGRVVGVRPSTIVTTARLAEATIPRLRNTHFPTTKLIPVFAYGRSTDISDLPYLNLADGMSVGK
jgi:hypothetical protein